VIPILIISDLFWSLAAFWVDFPKFINIPFYLWLVVPICPIYPALLLVVWFAKLKKLKPNRFLLAFAAFPSAILGPLAVVYYASQIYYNGFSLNDFGQIFWVLFYSVQGWYLVFREKITYWPLLCVSVYLLAKFWIDFKYSSFGYLQINKLPGDIQVSLLLFFVALTLGLFVFAYLKKPTS